MIPKVIHYCWFGGNPLTELAQKCIASWKKFCPDYEIIEWNESNYDVHKNQYMHQAYECRKWSFVSDYARLDIIYEHGGIYFDTDVELIKPIDDLLLLDAYAGREHHSEYVNVGLGFGACKGHAVIGAMRDRYNDLLFLKDGEMDLTPCPKIHTQALYPLGYKASKEVTDVCGMRVFPPEYFCPIDYSTNKMEITENTYSIHHYAASWFDETQQRALILKRKYMKWMPRKLATILATFVATVKCKGWRAAFRWVFKKRKK